MSPCWSLFLWLSINACVSDRTVLSSRLYTLASAWNSTLTSVQRLGRLWWLWFQGESSGTILNNSVNWGQHLWRLGTTVANCCKVLRLFWAFFPTLGIQGMGTVCVGNTPPLTQGMGAVCVAENSPPPNTGYGAVKVSTSLCYVLELSLSYSAGMWLFLLARWIWPLFIPSSWF